jgi:hypothetical protein
MAGDLQVWPDSCVCVHSVDMRAPVASDQGSMVRMRWNFDYKIRVRRGGVAACKLGGRIFGME